MNLYSVHNGIDLGRGNELHGGGLSSIKVRGPVVDLDACNHSVVGICVGAHSLLNQVLQIVGDLQKYTIELDKNM